MIRRKMQSLQLWGVSLLIIMGLLTLGGCSGGDSSSGCGSSTSTDANGNPITIVQCD